MSLTARLNVFADAKLSVLRGFSQCDAPALIRLEKGLSFGDDAGFAERAITERYTIAASGTQVIDLCGVTDALGDSVAMGSVKVLLLAASAANPGTVTVKPNVTNPWTAPFNAATDVVRCEPGGAILLASTEGDGWAVYEDSADKLLLTNTSGGGAAIVDLLVLGIDGRWDGLWDDGLKMGWDDGVTIEST